MLSLLLVACMGGAELPAPSAGLPASRLHTLAGTPALRLADRLDEAELVLPPTNRPEGPQPGRFVLDRGWEQTNTKAGTGTAWAVDAPVALPGKRNPTLPEGMSLHSGRDSLLYRCPPRGQSRTWCAQDGRILVSSKDDPGSWKQPPTLVAAGVEQALARLDRASAGLDTAAYMRHELTVDRETRPGLLLPAPGQATWTVQVPAEASLDLGLVLAPFDVEEGPSSDGAAVVVRVNGEELDRWAVEPHRGFRDVRVDLSAWGGQTVQLTLESVAVGSADWDYVFLAEPTLWGRTDAPVRRVVMVGLDTTRWASFTQNGYHRDTTVALDPFAESSALFDNAWTPAPRTRPSFRTATTGFYPLEAMSQPTIGEVLRALGFATGGVTANVHLVPRFGFNDGYDYWIYENSVSAAEEIGRAQAWLTRNADRDAFLFLHLMDPHAWYNAPLLYRNRYVEGEAGPLSTEMNRWMVLQERLSPENKQWLQDRYDGELRYTADELADFLAWVAGLPGETLIIVHSDHGEEFWEHGGYEHNHTLYRELVHAVMWIRPPGGWGGGPHRVDLPTGIVDIAPTIYDFVGVPAELRPDTDGVSLRPLLDAGLADQKAALEAQLAGRALPIGHLMYDRERWAVVADGQVYILHTWSGKEELYDLKTDPGQQKNLASTSDRSTLDGRLARLADATQWPAGPGWRVQVESAKTPFTLRFAAPAEGVVIDPEAESLRRANVEWGVMPRVLPEDVGLVTRSADGLELTFTPGSHGEGLVAVRTGDWAAVAELRVGADVVAIPATGGTFRLGEVLVHIEPGPVILPLDNENNHLRGAGAGEEESMEALRRLGYVE